MDQKSHINQSVLNDHFDKDKEKVKYIKFKYELYASLPLDDKDKEETENIFGKYNNLRKRRRKNSEHQKDIILFRNETIYQYRFSNKHRHS